MFPRQQGLWRCYVCFWMLFNNNSFHYKNIFGRSTSQKDANNALDLLFLDFSKLNLVSMEVILIKYNEENFKYNDIKRSLG